MTLDPTAGPLPSPAEQAAAGKAARVRAPRSSHGAWEPSPGREDPIAILERQAVSRVPSLVPIRYARMVVSPFTFFRGAAAVMAADLNGTPDAGQRVQLCGDAHLSNFGIFDSPEREQLFDLNDFDETLPGPWEWDLKRLAASGMIAARDNGQSKREQETTVCAGAKSYREAMRNFAAMSNLDVWYARIDVNVLLTQLQQEGRGVALARTSAKARRKTSLRAFSKLAVEVDGEPRIRSAPPLIVPLADLAGTDGYLVADQQATLQKVVDGYRASLQDDRRHLVDTYRFADAAVKVVGVGSVGTRAWIVLTTGRDRSDPLFLQAKEAQASVLEPYLGASQYPNHGQRVVEGQRLMQAASDALLGWLPSMGSNGEERDFYIRQLWDGKGSAEIDAMDASTMADYMTLCGWTLARAHARSGPRMEIAGYLGNGSVFDDAIVRFSAAYADQNECDHAALQAAIASGRIVAAPAGS